MREEKAIAPAGELSAEAVRCSQCGYRNNAAWKICYACGVALVASRESTGPEAKPIASFERATRSRAETLSGRTRAAGGRRSASTRSYVSLEESQDWLGYDFLKADLFTDARKPMNLDVEIRDTATR